AKSYAWYLGLALLLAGEEAEAQTTWMLAMVEGDEADIAQWTRELIAVLQTEAERREALEDTTTAWLIRQHLREIDPDEFTNLLHLVEDSIALKTFSATDLHNWGVISQLQSQRETVDRSWLLDVLRQLLDAAPLEPETLEFIEACLQLPHPTDVVYVVMNAAIDIGNNLAQPSIAIRYINLCLQVFPSDLNALSQLSYFYQNAGKHEDGIAAAREYCMQAQAIADQVFGVFLLLRAWMRAGNYWDEIFPLFQHQDTLIDELAAQQTEPLDQSRVFQLTTAMFCQPYLRDSLARNRLNQNRVLGLCQSSVQAHHHDRILRYQQGIAARLANRDAKKPLRIGYLSHCLRRHSVGWLSRWVFQHHDRDQFQIYGYFWNAPKGPVDDLQAWFADHVDEARMLNRDSGTIADQIFADEIDILVDLDSITADIVCEVMMLKAAPVQVTWLGWDASGIPVIDYFIVDPYVLPDGAEAHYSEKLWRLPQTYVAVDGFEVGVPTLRREDLDIPTDAVVYWSGQSSYKRHPDSARSQMRILKSVPDSYCLIKGITDESSIQQYFLQLAQEEGVAGDRLRFLPNVTQEAVHRANLRIADVVLDTYPYNGATTTLETLWMGIPMVTRVGEHFSSRNSYTMMRNAGITEGIAWTEDEYVQWGIRLGKDADLRQQIAWKLWQSRHTA
ncbi:O-linked N-acetylglucosamine transferase, SPINDLY family protein, partial [Leptolyngbya sp. FACHB-36]|uniref:O-linked N-acetylglucosamine transferase, SPINDLY family protein n=1 Tax=Leptolyngbya sp. FACHB-36 TaxID=2692808 RepID=UPI0016802B05